MEIYTIEVFLAMHWQTSPFEGQKDEEWPIKRAPLRFDSQPQLKGFLWKHLNHPQNQIHSKVLVFENWVRQILKQDTKSYSKALCSHNCFLCEGILGWSRGIWHHGNVFDYDHVNAPLRKCKTWSREKIVGRDIFLIDTLSLFRRSLCEMVHNNRMREHIRDVRKWTAKGNNARSMLLRFHALKKTYILRTADLDRAPQLHHENAYQCIWILTFVH